MAIEISNTERNKVRRDLRYVEALNTYNRRTELLKRFEADLDAAYEAQLPTYDKAIADRIAAAKSMRDAYIPVVEEAKRKVTMMMLYGIFE